MEASVERLKQGMFAVLIAITSFYCMMTTDYRYLYAIGITVAVSLATGWFLYPRVYAYLMPYVREHIGSAILVFLWAEYTAYSMFLHNAHLAQERCILGPFLFRWWGYGIAGLGIWLVLLVAVRFLSELVTDVWRKLDGKIRREYLWFSVVLSTVVVICYCAKPGWYTFFDRIYSLDSGSLLGNLYGNPEFIEPPHPLYGIIGYPIATAIQGIGAVFVPRVYDTLFLAIGVQLVCVQAILWSGLLLQRMTKHAYIFRVYCCTNAVLLYSIALEKYQLAAFFVVLYVYLRIENRAGSDTAIVLSAGTMLTSAWIGILELLGTDPVKEKGKRIGRILLWSVVLMIASGHFLFFHQEVFYLFGMQREFAVDIPLLGRLQAVFWMIQSAFVPLNNVEDAGFVVWRDVTTGWSIIGIACFAIMIYGFLRKYRERLYQIAFAWVVLAFVLFVPLNWAVIETPLFNILFLWAILILLVEGMDGILKKMKLSAGVVYTIMSIICFVAFVLDYLFILRVM